MSVFDGWRCSLHLSGFAVISPVLSVASLSMCPERSICLGFSETFARPALMPVQLDIQPESGPTCSWDRPDRKWLISFFWDSFSLSRFSLTWLLKEMVSMGSRNIASFKERPNLAHHGPGRLHHRTPGYVILRKMPNLAESWFPL